MGYIVSTGRVRGTQSISLPGGAGRDGRERGERWRKGRGGGKRRGGREGEGKMVKGITRQGPFDSLFCPRELPTVLNPRSIFAFP